MFCFHCGHQNEPHANFCADCSARLPRMDRDREPGPTLEVEDGREYVVPQRSFPTQYLYDLTCRAYEYIHQEAPGEPLVHAWYVVQAALETFEEEDLPALLARLREEKAKAPEDDYWTQMPYLLNRGVQLMHEGFERMEAFLECGDVEVLKDAVTRMQEGNDSLGLARELATARKGRP